MDKINESLHFFCVVSASKHIENTVGKGEIARYE